MFLRIRYLHFRPDVLIMQEDGFARKLRLILKFMTSQTGQQIITIIMLPIS